MPAPVRSLISAAGRRVARIIDDEAIDLAISTYLFGGRVIGAARQVNHADVPVITYVTDPAVHPLWIDRSSDLYLATWSFTTSILRQSTATPALLVAPAVAESFRGHPSPARSARRLSREKPWALIVSGSWGVGDVVGTARDVLEDGRFRPVVVCGNNTRLLSVVEALPGVIALGWVRNMASLMSDCAVAVLNSGGLTLAEAATAGLPVVHHKPLPGQGELNAVACRDGAGTPVSYTAADLREALDRATPLAATLGEADPVATILAAGDREAITARV